MNKPGDKGKPGFFLPVLRLRRPASAGLSQSRPALVIVLLILVSKFGSRARIHEVNSLVGRAKLSAYVNRRVLLNLGPVLD